MRNHLGGFCLGVFVLLVGGTAGAIPGDLAGDDGVVTKEDILEFIESWHKKEGEAGYNALADTNGDGVIDSNDLVELGDVFLQAIVTPIPTPATPEPTLTATATPTEAMPTATSTSTPPPPTATPELETPTPGEPTATSTFTSTPLPPTATPGLETPTPTTTPLAATFDILDYFPMGTGDTWHYIGWDGGSTDDNFRWTVEGTTQPVGVYQATRIRTNTDEPTDDRNLDVDFWIADSGNLLFGGMEKGSEVDLPSLGFGFSLPVQTILLNPPVTFGTSGMRIGDSAGGSSSTSLTIDTPAGPQTIPGSLDLTVQYTSLLPTRNTPMGDFTNVLRVLVDLDATVTLPFVGEKSFSIRGNTFFLKEEVGMIAQDQEPDQNDAEIQAIDEGTVGGVAVVAH